MYVGNAVRFEHYTVSMTLRMTFPWRAHDSVQSVIGLGLDISNSKD